MDRLRETFNGSTSSLAIVGAALFWLWMDAGVFSSTLLGLGSVGDGGLYSKVFFVTTLVTVTVLAIPLVVPALIDASTLSRRWRMLSVAVGACGLAGSVALILAGSRGSVPLAVAGSVLNGICFAHLNVMWGWICVAQGHTKAILHISAAWALGLPFNLLFAALPPIASAVTVALLPPLSVMVYQMLCALQDKPAYRIESARREIVDVFGGRGTVLGFDARLLALILVFCAVFGLIYALQAVSPDWIPVADGPGASQGEVAGMVGVRGLTALVFFVAYLTVLHDRVQMLFKTCFYILVAGLAVMVLGVFVPELRAASPLMVAVGYCGFDVLVWTMVAFHGYTSKSPLAKSVTVAMLAEQTGIFIGFLLGLGMRRFDVSVAAETGIMLALDLLAMAVLVAYTEYGSRLWTMLVRMSIGSDEAFSAIAMGRTDKTDSHAVQPGRDLADHVHGASADAQRHDDGQGDAAPADLPIASNDAFESKMTQFASHYGLTRREQEMLSVFVQGRSMAYIAEKLFVSENTVKTHIRHAYTKCGVHNKQEMIDLVESFAEKA